MRRKLAIVIAATESIEAVRRCLGSIAIAAHDRLIVAYDPLRIDGRILPSGVIRIEGEPGANAHRLRFLGMSQSDEPIVVFTEDSCVVSNGWAEAWREAFSDDAVWAASGPVEPQSGGTIVDRAVFLCEYAPFLAMSGGTGRVRPVAAGIGSRRETITRLAGNNFAVRRDLLNQDRHDIHESEVAQRVRNLGGKSVEIPAAIVWHERHYSLREAVLDRFRFGYGFGQLCAGKSTKWRRLLQITLGPGILISQLGRLAWTLAKKRRGGAMLLTSGPLTFALLTAWSVGEWLGWITGTLRTSGEAAAHMPSRALDRVQSEPRDYTPPLAST